jgi:hypothetical protein
MSLPSTGLNPKMTNIPYDQFSKQYLEELLAPFGEVNISHFAPDHPQRQRTLAETAEASHLPEEK